MERLYCILYCILYLALVALLFVLTPYVVKILVELLLSTLFLMIDLAQRLAFICELDNYIGSSVTTISCEISFSE